MKFLNAVVKPCNAIEVSKILRYADERKIPVWIHGSGTALHGATRPKCKCIVLNTSRMSDIEFFEDYGYIECGAGVRVLELSKILENKGYFLPLIPGSRMVSTVGGGIAVNTSEHMVDSCFGKPIDYVLGLEVVLPNGEIIETGQKLYADPQALI
jgi:glycolate oxidase